MRGMTRRFFATAAPAAKVPPARLLRQAARDAGLGILVFLALAFAATFERDDSGAAVISGSFHAPAYALSFAADDPIATHATRPVMPATSERLTPRRPSWQAPALGPERMAALALLGALFAAVFAFNAAVFRHLRRVYASPRRGGWRRG